MDKIAPDYSEQQVLLYSIDLEINPKVLIPYLDERAPTIRVFSNGKMIKSYFVGDQTETFVRKFLDSIAKPLQTNK